MKVEAGRVRALAAAPDSRLHGYLLFGPDAAETDALRARLCAALVESSGGDLRRIEASEARRDPAVLHDALREAGLFGGRPVVLVEGATDALAEAAKVAVDGLSDQDGALVMTAGTLAARSKLRAAFEGAPTLAAMGIYPRPMGREEIAGLLREEGAPGATPEAMDALAAIAAQSEGWEVRALIRSLALRLADGEAPATEADVAACQPAERDGDLDEVAAAAFTGRADAALAAFGRAAGRSGAATGVALALGRLCRQLHALATAKDGASSAAARLRPPVFGPRRDALLRLSRTWPAGRCEAALRLIFDAELGLRSTGGPSDRAAAERLIVRISALPR